MFQKHPSSPLLFLLLLVSFPFYSLANPSPAADTTTNGPCIPKFSIPGVSDLDQQPWAQIPNPDGLPPCPDSVGAGAVTTAAAAGPSSASVSDFDTEKTDHVPSAGNAGFGTQEEEGGEGGGDVSDCWYDDDPEEMKPKEGL